MLIEQSSLGAKESILAPIRMAEVENLFETQKGEKKIQKELIRRRSRPSSYLTFSFDIGVVAGQVLCALKSRFRHA